MSINSVNLLPLRTLPHILFTDVDFYIHDPEQDDPQVVPGYCRICRGKSIYQRLC